MRDFLPCNFEFNVSMTVKRGKAHLENGWTDRLFVFIYKPGDSENVKTKV